MSEVRGWWGSNDADRDDGLWTATRLDGLTPAQVQERYRFVAYFDSEQDVAGRRTVWFERTVK